ncbi:MAG: 23S rRNA (pseudouridine(1915)-N(3))-methyltransferase RlmH [Bdellovibrionales bacterium]
MKLVLLTMESSRETWSEEAFQTYTKKINPLLPFERITLKSPARDRKEASEKIKAESELLIEKILPGDFVVLCDERGKTVTSRAFSDKMQGVLSGGKKRCVFLVGGAYGVSEAIKKRADYTMQLAPFTLNHLVAQTVLMEQIFRSLTIWKNIPYHND